MADHPSNPTTSEPAGSNPPEAASRRGLTVTEKIMLNMIGLWLVGILIYGFLPEGPVRASAMALFIGAVAYMLFRPIGISPKRKN